MKLQSKLPHTGTSIFAIMSGLASEVGAINLSQGFPDFSPSSELISLVHQAMQAGHNQYAPMPGILTLRQQLASKMESLYHVNYNPETEITITSGATQGLYTAISALIRPGDEVIVIEPAYDSYVPAIRLYGGIPVFIQLKGPDFAVDWDEVKSKITDKTRLFMLNTPHNPTGALWQDSDWRELQQLAIQNDLLIISDEVYEHLVFDGHQHESILRYPALKERSIACYSFGKVFHNTGWKMGYCVGGAKIMKEFRKVHQFLVFSCNTPIQYALTEFLKDERNYLELNKFFQNKRDLLLNELNRSRFSFEPTPGTYFQLLDYSNISDLGDFDFCVELTQKHGVAAIPISAFYHDGRDDQYIRLCFAKSDELIRQATKNLSQL